MYSLRHVASWNLLNQGLLRRFNTATEVVTSLVALQAQSYPSVKMAIRRRCRLDFDLDQLLSPGGPLTRLWTVRGTLHIVPTQEAYLHVQATREDWLNRWGRYLTRRLPDERSCVMQNIYPQIAAALSDEPLTTEDISATVQLPQCYSRLLPHLLKEMCYLGLAVRGSQPRGRACYFRPWYPRPQVTPAQARKILITKFIAAYGPVTYQDIAYWSGFRAGVVKEVLQQITDIAAVPVENSRHPAYILQSQLDQFRALPRDIVLPQLRLPAYDVLLLAYKNKTRFISKQHQKKVFLSTARVLPIVLEDGRVVATWDEKSRAVQRFEP